MHSTHVIAARSLASTYRGQRRILKYKPTIFEYIEKSVKAGTYRTREELAAMNDKLADNPTNLNRLRWNTRRGSYISDYPFEYHAMSVVPPPPQLPTMPKKYLRHQAHLYRNNKANRPIETYAGHFLTRQKRDQRQGKAADKEGAYDRLLGIQFPKRIDSALANKSALLQKAYQFAIKQFHVMRADPKLSEEEAIQQVEELLQQDRDAERYESRAKAEQVRKRREEFNATRTDKDEDLHPQVRAVNRAKGIYPKAMIMKKSRNKKKEAVMEGGVDLDDPDQYTEQFYSSDQRAFSGMISWTYRLQAVPYDKWTVGASTALDHWIAKRVLGISEATWLALIEGKDPSLLSRGRDIVMARHALFPETMVGDQFSKDEMQAQNSSMDEAAAGDGGNSTGSNIDDDINTLLAALGWDNDEKDEKKKDDFDWEDGEGENDQILVLTEQLQGWRSKQAEKPYEEWSDEQKNEFQLWLRGYVETLVPESALGTVNLEATRKSLLATPPQTKEDSETFWNSIRDETAAEEFLDRLLEAGKPDNLDDLSHGIKLFWQMPYQEQLQHLTEKGTIREMLDEYTSEKDREKFWLRYGDHILEGLMVEHLVPDPNGPISLADIGGRLKKRFKISEGDRFRIEKIPYRSANGSTERAKELLEEWNKLKAGRAHYEEKLYQNSMLGLRYRKKDLEPKKVEKKDKIGSQGRQPFSVEVRPPPL